MKTLKLEKIEWKTFWPIEFPCFICGKGRAEYFLRYSNGVIDANLVVCNNCKEIPVEKFEKCVFGKEL